MVRVAPAELYHLPVHWNVEGVKNEPRVDILAVVLKELELFVDAIVASSTSILNESG